MANTRKRGTRGNLPVLEKAARLFHENGYDKTSIRDIAHGCGCEASSIYHYFSGKREILFQLLWSEQNYLNSLVKHLEQESSGTPVERLRLFCDITVGINKNPISASGGVLFPAGLRNLSPSQRKQIISSRDEYEGILRKIMSDGISTGDFLDTDIKLASYLISSMIVRIRVWYHPSGKLSLEQIAQYLFEFCYKALKNS